MPHRPPLAPLAVLCVAAASLLLAACGGSDAPSSALAKEQLAEQRAETKFADFAKCLREHGVNAEAISHSGGGHGVKVSPGSGGPQQFEAAEKACARYRPPPQKLNLSPQEKVERAEAVEKFAKCMREHGIEVHASSSEGRVSIQIHGKPGGGGPNPESPAFQKAQQSCQGLLPFKGKGSPAKGGGLALPQRTGGPGSSESGGGHPSSGSESGASLSTGG